MNDPSRESPLPERQDRSPSSLVAPEQREAAITRLSAAFARDILPLDEFERRTAEVYRVTTLAKLDELLGDLPTPDAARASARRVPAGLEVMPPRITTVLANLERGGQVVVPSRLEVRAVLGNVELDLRDAEFDGGVTEISVDAILGNVEIALPDRVEVENHGSAFLGSFSARRRRGSRRAEAPAATVRITGRAVLGNVEFESRGDR